MRICQRSANIRGSRYRDGTANLLASTRIHWPGRAHLVEADLEDVPVQGEAAGKQQNRHKRVQEEMRRHFLQQPGALSYSVACTGFEVERALLRKA